MDKYGDEYFDRKDDQRVAREFRAMDRREAREAVAIEMIKELTRDGKTVYYVHPEGGRYRESAHLYDLVEFLIRNRYA